MNSEVSIPTFRRRRLALFGSTRVYATAAGRYWLRVFPVARACLSRLRARARAIPDPLLREDALISHKHKAANSEGLAALAVLAPPEHRAEVTRSLVSFQLMLDYLDGVSERPAGDAVANGLRLHSAFSVALDPDASHEDYYALAPGQDDGGYLVALIETCRAPLRDLPSYPAARGALLRQARLCCESQALFHAPRDASLDERIRQWAMRTAAEVGLDEEFEWWELIAAAAASSLCIGALLALAAAPGATEADARRVESAYFPWASGLNALLDSLVDLDEDPEDVSHLRRYPSTEVAAARLARFAAGARSRVAGLPRGEIHEEILAAMGALYLARPEAWRPEIDLVSTRVLDALGPHARISLGVHVLRRGGRGATAVLRRRRTATEDGREVHTVSGR
jgi:tetraprenyl-beta-curcumene synthase